MNGEDFVFFEEGDLVVVEEEYRKIPLLGIEYDYDGIVPPEWTYIWPRGYFIVTRVVKGQAFVGPHPQHLEVAKENFHSVPQNAYKFRKIPDPGRFARPAPPPQCPGLPLIGVVSS